MNQPDIGEQAISKAAEIGMKSQLDEVEDLDVDIKANPLDLAQGKVESVTVDGQGMVMNEDLRADRLILHTDSIDLDPLKATFGNIELEKSTNAEAKLVLLEEDIQRAFNSAYIQDKLSNQQIELEGEKLTVNARNVKFTLPDRDRLYLQADINITESGETKQISLSAKPTVNSKANKIVLENVEYEDNNDNNSTLAKALLDSTEEILDLSNFELEEISLQIKKIEIGQGKLTIAGSALVEDFPAE